MSNVATLKLNAEIKADIEGSVLCWLATVDDNGVPNVTPKEIFSSYGDDRIIVADIASPNTVRNIRKHPSVCVSFIDIFRQRGFKITGAASIIEKDDPAFSIVGAELLQMAGNDFPIRHIISIDIKSISRILAPSYKLFPERTEHERIESAYDSYGVEPKPSTKTTISSRR